MSLVLTTILLDSNPKGFRVIEIGNWSGKAFVVPRSKLKDLRTRNEANQPGLYILFGEGVDRSRAYIGQSESVAGRLLTHDINREEDEWDTAVLFVGSLDSTPIKYLESISLDLAKKANRYDIFNSATPKENTISEAQKIVVMEYFERVKIITGFLGYSIFDVVEDVTVDKGTYILKADGVEAKAQLLDDGSLNVSEGALARIRETESFGGWSKAARIRLIDQGILIKNDEVSYRLTQDFIFNSPSAAAATLLGRSVNGWTSWKDEKGNTLDENVRK